MANDESSAPRPGPVVLRIKLRYDDVDTMVHRFAANAGRSGLFLPTKSIQPIGTEVKFELRLANDTPVLVGQGRVKASREPDKDNPKQAFGMAVELIRVTRESRTVILRMLERRKAMGLADVALPMPEDIDAARRFEIDSGVRVPDAIPTEASAPADGLLTSPRRSDSDGFAVAALAPERPRKPRPRVHEVIDRAVEKSGKMIAAMSVVGVDEYVDIGRALMRAHALATGDLDAELAALRDEAAAPIEISVEAASAELARQLGGVPVVRRDRSGGWAPPPEVAKPAVEVARETFSAVMAEEVPEEHPEEAPEEASHSGVDAVALIESEAQVSTDPAASSVTPHRFAMLRGPAEPDLAIVTPPAGTELPAGMLIDDDMDPAQFDGERTRGPEPEAREPVPVDDAFDTSSPDSFEHEVGDDDYAESTQIGALPILAPDSSPTMPAVSDDLADKLDAQLDEAEAEAERILQDEPPPDDEEIMEIDDFEILAEADADDADLLLADGEADAPPQPEGRAATPHPELDFDRFDLGDDSALHAPVPADLDDAPSEIAPPPIQPDEHLHADDFDEPHAFSPPAYDHAALAAPTVDPYKPQRANTPDLEAALSDLDVEFDDFGSAESPIHRVKPRMHTQVKKRAVTDEGVLIDFDDEE